MVKCIWLLLLTPFSQNLTENPTETPTDLWSHQQGFHFAGDSLHVISSSWHYVSMLSQGRLVGISTSQTSERPAYNDTELQKVILMLRENNTNLITLS